MKRPSRRLPGSAQTLPRWSRALLCAALMGCLTSCATTTKPHVVSHPDAADLKSRSARNDALRLETLPVPVLLERAEANLVQGNYPMARLHYSAALRKDPESDAALAGLGEIMLREENFTDAREAFGKALEKNEECLRALVGKGKACRALGEYAVAIELLSRAVELDPQSPENLAELAIAYEASGQGAQAEPLFLQVVERDGSAWAYGNLGFNYLLQKRYEEAVPVLERALRMEPGDQRVLNNLALACAMTGQEKRALRLFERSVGKAGAYNNVGYIHMVRGNWQEAEESFQQALAASPAFYVRAKENLELLGEMIRVEAKENLAELKELTQGQ